jgi:hypothetical protein
MVQMISLANTREPLYFIVWPGNAPSNKNIAYWIDRAIEFLLKAGFKKVVVRGDTDFSQTEHLDRWDDQPVTFYCNRSHVTMNTNEHTES